MAAANNTSVSAGGVPQFSPWYSVGKYIHKYYGHLEARRSLILPAGLILTVFICLVQCETGNAGWRRRSKPCCGRRDDDDHTHDTFRDMPFIRSVEGGPYEKRLIHVIL